MSITAHIVLDDLAAMDTVLGNASSASNLLTLRGNYVTMNDALANLTGALHTRVHGLLDAIHSWLTGDEVPAGSITSTIDGFNTSAEDFISEF